MAQHMKTVDIILKWLLTNDQGYEMNAKSHAGSCTFTDNGINVTPQWGMHVASSSSVENTCYRDANILK